MLLDEALQLTADNFDPRRSDFLSIELLRHGVIEIDRHRVGIGLAKMKDHFGYFSKQVRVMLKDSVYDRVSGIHSKQPWFVLGAAQEFLLYHSDIPSISHFYSFEADPATEQVLAIPDGCVDILFDCDEQRPTAKVCGTTLEATNAEFIHNHRYFGVRFVPGVIPDFLKASAQELIEHQLNLLDIMPNADRVFEQIVSSSVFANQVGFFEKFYKNQLSRKLSILTKQTIHEVFIKKGNIQIQDLEASTGYCTRTLQRQFRADMGMSPKAFSRIIRCQSAVYDLNHNKGVTFSDLACDLGFSDQSHFLREFKKLVSATPLDYLNRVKHETYVGRLRYF
ncbi:helix-turn-helix domain-containing protein [Marinomonas sp. RS-M-Aa-14]|uniref:helix-turn-helix domain-containing protein n=1 Tax=Marinomonas sp. RS-M-Aa-14 TaxID=3241169 RepID=UPI003AACBF4E